MRTVDLRSSNGWEQTTIPGSAPPVAILRLHADGRTRASTSLVRFPPGWQRPGTGHYEVGEEVVLLDGALTVTGLTYGVGDYGWLPAGAERTASATEGGALALAWFSGPPRWLDGPGRPEAAGTRLRLPGVRLDGEGRQLRGGAAGDAHGEAWLLPSGRAADAPGEVLDLDTWRWTLLERGDPPLATSSTSFARRP